MFLSSIEIVNFRAIRQTIITFNKGLNVLIGRNNTGKSTIIDALRICFSYGKQWREIYVTKDDFYVDQSNPNAAPEPIQFHLTFNVEEREEAGIFYELLKQGQNGTQEIQIHFRYYLDTKGKLKWTVWGGENEGQRISSDIMDLINFVYLSPLRDAVSNLRPVRGNRIGELFASLATDSEGKPLDEEKKQELAYKIANTIKEDTDWTRLIESGEKRINEHLNNITIEGEQRPVELGFLPFEFRRLVENIQAQCPIFDKELIEDSPKKQRYFQLFQNGLGYNNLIYIAVVMGDLISKKEVEKEAYYSLLIEEPEAHLHPQLQSLFFSYMNRLKEKGIQLFITSHSPTITSKVELDSLLVQQKQGQSISNIALKDSGLDSKNKAYLQKFLDVTKSQLFFANGVILVEGISEALLLPIFAEKEKYDLNKLGVEIVNIGGIAFEHFAKLFNNQDEKKNLSARCSIITDYDNKEDRISARAQKAKKLQRGNLAVFLANVTFENELYTNNEEVVRRVYQEMHRNTEIKDSTDFVGKIKNNKDKSEFAHNLAVQLAEKNEIYRNFQVPPYIKHALQWVAEGKQNVQ